MGEAGNLCILYWSEVVSHLAPSSAQEYNLHGAATAGLFDQIDKIGWYVVLFAPDPKK